MTWKPPSDHPFNLKARAATLKSQAKHKVDKLQVRKQQAIALLLENEENEDPWEIDSFFRDYHV